MSFISWAFVFGGLAVAFPVLFHLIRRVPRGRVPFGSLMFLRQSPPRITRRSRIDNWLLLLLRGLVILLLAAAFMRPFVRSTSNLFLAEPPGSQLAILIDTSASMKRDGLWPRALARVRVALDDARPGDRLALFEFSDGLREVTGFDPDETASPASQRAMIEAQLAKLTPGWTNTRLGEALTSLARILSESRGGAESEGTRRILLISDLQAGSDLAELQGENWPADVRVEIARINPDRPDNATLRLANERDLTSGLWSPDGPRVRVINNANSTVDQFSVGWSDEKGELDSATAVVFHVPPGSSVVFPVPRPANLDAGQLLLEGDDSPFDNRYFVADAERRELTIDWLGERDAPDDGESALYFLKRVFPETPGRRVIVQTLESGVGYMEAGAVSPRMVVVGRTLAGEETIALREYAEQGGVVLVVLGKAAMLESVLPLLGPVVSFNVSPPTDDYAMLAGINFSHPLFAPLAGPRYNDFSRIRFWRTVPIRVPDDSPVATIARFDNGNAAITEHRIGKGVVIGLATSWEPQFSQLALSTRFLPLMWGMTRLSGASLNVPLHYEVGDRFGIADGNGPWNLEYPDGTIMKLSSTDMEKPILDQPGRYVLTSDAGSTSIVANLASAESVTAPLQADHLETLGVVTGASPDRTKAASDLKKVSESRMEASQRIWKWLIVAALVLLMVETGLAGARR